MEEAKVSIFLYYRYRFTIENTVDIGGSRHAWAAIHHNAGFVRSKVDFHTLCYASGTVEPGFPATAAPWD